MNECQSNTEDNLKIMITDEKKKGEGDKDLLQGDSNPGFPGLQSNSLTTEL